MEKNNNNFCQANNAKVVHLIDNILILKIHDVFNKWKHVGCKIDNELC
jgi:hypothetical protein